MGERDRWRLSGRLRRHAFLTLKRLGARGGPKRLIVVAGVQRSGTNMLMNLLEASPVTQVYHERDGRLYDDYMMRDDATVARLIEASAHPVVVIKALHEPERVRPLLDRFAPAQAIWLFRNWPDTVHSNRKSWPEGRNRLDDIVQDPKLGGWRSAAMSAETLHELREAYRPDLTREDAQALFYYHRNKLAFELGLADDPRVLIADYDAIVTDLDTGLPPLAAFLGLELTARMRAVPRASGPRTLRRPVTDPTIAGMCDRLYARLKGETQPAPAMAHA